MGKQVQISQTIEAHYLPKQEPVTFNPAKVKKLTGLTVTEEEMIAILQRLGIEVDNKNSVWIIDPPSHRFDIQLEADLIEEIHPPLWL